MQSGRPIELRIAGSAGRLSSSLAESPHTAQSNSKQNDTLDKNGAVQDDDDEEGAIPESSDPPTSLPPDQGQPPLSGQKSSTVPFGSHNTMLCPPRSGAQSSHDTYRPTKDLDRSRNRPYERDADRYSTVDRNRWDRSDRRRGLSPPSLRSPPSARDAYRAAPYRADMPQQPPPSAPSTFDASISATAVPPPPAVRRQPFPPRSPSPSAGLNSTNAYEARRSGNRLADSYVPARDSRSDSGWARNGYDRNSGGRRSDTYFPSKDVPRRDATLPSQGSRSGRWSPPPSHRQTDTYVGSTFAGNVDRWQPEVSRSAERSRTKPLLDNGARPPSRTGRADPPPPMARSDATAPPSTLLSPQQASTSIPHAQEPAKQTHKKRSRSPSSPPAGLLKRKSNFDALSSPVLAASGDVVPEDLSATKRTFGANESSEPVTALVNTDSAGNAAPEIPLVSAGSETNTAPGAPLVKVESETNTAPGAPRVNTLESPVLHSNTESRIGSALIHNADTNSTTGTLLASRRPSVQQSDGPKVSRVTVVCGSLDDPLSSSVRLSCTPRRREDVPMSGRERRKARPAALPLDKRIFLGCSSLDDYEISVKLGQGTFGEVLKGRHILTGLQVALKKVTIHDDKDGLPITALREIKLLKKLRHPSVVPVLDMTYRSSGERGKLGDVYMVEPYMDHDLNGMLENPNIRLEHSQIKLYMKQLLEGTLYLHKNRILHRDMKAANLLINNLGQLQIADFGLARPYRDPGRAWADGGWKGGLNKYTNMVVTRWYRPPELLAGEKKYGPPIDLWGIGCILAEMVTGKPLFKGTSEINQLELISRLCGSPNETNFPGWSALPGVKDADPSGRPDPHPEVSGKHEFGAYHRNVKEYFRSVVDVGPECADLIDKLLVLDPTKRITAQQALDHEWFWTKPFPADPTTLPKYEHSKEIDRQKRDWKPSVIQAQKQQAQAHQHMQNQQQNMAYRPQAMPRPPVMPSHNGPPAIGGGHSGLPGYHYNHAQHDGGVRPPPPPFSRANAGYPPPTSDVLNLDYGNNTATGGELPRNGYQRSNQPYQPSHNQHQHRRPFPTHNSYHGRGQSGYADRRFDSPSGPGIGSGGGGGRDSGGSRPSRPLPPGIQPSLPPRPPRPPNGAGNPYA